MIKIRKLLTKFASTFASTTGKFKWSELPLLLSSLGFDKIEGEGSRVTFVNHDHVIIKLHKPHPQKEVKAYAVKQIKEILKNEGLL